MASPQRMINDPADLDRLSVLPLGRRRIRLDVQGFSQAEQLVWEKRLNRAYRATGAGEAVAGFLIGLILGGIIAVQASADGSLGIAGALATVGLIIVPTLTGKLVGLFRAQAQLRGIVADLQEKWPGSAETAVATSERAA